MINLLGKLWQTNKTLLLCLLVYLCAASVILFNTASDYISLREVRGTVEDFRIDKDKATILKLNLEGDLNIYYQKYERRFYDKNIAKIKKHGNIHFYTLKNAQKRRAAISSLGDQSSFYYYPVFYINQTPSVFQVFLYEFYSSLILTILIVLSWALILYNGFSLALKSNIFIKFLLSIISIGMLWLVI